MSSKRFPNITERCATISVIPPHTHRLESPSCSSIGSLFPSYRRPTTADLTPDPCRQSHRYHYLLRAFINLFLFNWCCGCSLQDLRQLRRFVSIVSINEQHQHPVCHLRATNHNNSTHHLPRSQFNSGRFVIPYCRDIIHKTLTIPRPVRLTLQDRRDIDIFSQIPSPAHHAHHHLRPRQHQQQPTTITPSNRHTSHHRTVVRLSPFKFTSSTRVNTLVCNDNSSLEVLLLSSTSQRYDISSRSSRRSIYVAFFLSTAPTSSLQWWFM